MKGKARWTAFCHTPLDSPIVLMFLLCSNVTTWSTQSYTWSWPALRGVADFDNRFKVRSVAHILAFKYCLLPVVHAHELLSDIRLAAKSSRNFKRQAYYAWYLSWWHSQLGWLFGMKSSPADSRSILPLVSLWDIIHTIQPWINASPTTSNTNIHDIVRCNDRKIL